MSVPQNLTFSSRISLKNGITIPVLGLGVYKIPKEDTERVVRTALDIGYRHIDTAAYYGNEREVGKAIRASGIPREEIFVTTKLLPTRLFGVQAAFQESSRNLNLGYIDLYLIHWPFFRKRHAWKILQKIYADGSVKAIGVSNYRIADLEDLNSTGLAPMVNQVEFHPFLFRKRLLEYCDSRGIVVEAHSPLTHGKRMNDARISAIAEKHGKTPAQILIRWALQHGTAVIPKSTREGRMRENADVFDFYLSEDDMKKLDALNENYYAAGLSRLVGE